MDPQYQSIIWFFVKSFWNAKKNMGLVFNLNQMRDFVDFKGFEY